MPPAATMPAKTRLAAPQRMIRFFKPSPVVFCCCSCSKLESRCLAFLGLPEILAAFLHEPALFARPVALLFALALVVQFLAAADGEQQLGTALVVEVDFQRHQRHAFAVDALRQFCHLALVEQQLAAPPGLVVEAV